LGEWYMNNWQMQVTDYYQFVERANLVSCRFPVSQES
jgi:hypothetical protein